MELFLLNGEAGNYPSLQKFQPVDLVNKILAGPEAVVFILSEVEWGEFMVLHASIQKQAQGVKGQKGLGRVFQSVLEEAEKKGSLMSIITLMGAHPGMGMYTKVGGLRLDSLGSFYGVFYSKPGEESKRANIITRALTIYQSIRKNKPSLS